MQATDLIFAHPAESEPVDLEVAEFERSLTANKTSLPPTVLAAMHWTSRGWMHTSARTLAQQQGNAGKAVMCGLIYLSGGGGGVVVTGFKTSFTCAE